MDNFSFFSKKLLFEETNGDIKLETNKLRKIVALDFYGSVELGESNRFLCDLLKDNLEAYSKVVDDPKGVNNYVQEVTDVLPNNLLDNVKQWKSEITVSRVAEILTPMPCSKDNPGKWEKLSCQKSKLTEEDIKSFREAQSSYKPQKSVKLNVPPKSEEKRKIPEKVPKPTISNPEQRNVAQRPKIGLSSNCEKSTEESNIGDFKLGAFKTAGQEFRLQNLKKFGTNSAGDKPLAYGSGKKSLGGLGVRRGINAPFKPPILHSESEEKKEEPKDERLKNLDPKLVEMIQNEIMDSGPKVSWDDIAGLEFAKTTIQEVVVWPMLRPDIFTGLRRPPRGILLFGPPGTGKTLIGKCIASQSGATFLSISASSLTSKWIGEGEKLVRTLFAVARVNQPSVIFIDEIDSLLSQRSDTEHESSRRLKTEFLVQLDGVGTGDEDRILIIGATNRPQELDEAARRRLVKRLYIPLPQTKAREEIVRNLISKERHTLTEGDMQEIAELTEGYSGADMKHVCQEASLGPIRSIPPMQIRDIDTSQVRAVNITDFKSALLRVKSTVSQNDLHNYLSWDKQFGCGTI